MYKNTKNLMTEGQFQLRIRSRQQCKCRKGCIERIRIYGFVLWKFSMCVLTKKNSPDEEDCGHNRANYIRK